MGLLRMAIHRLLCRTWLAPRRIAEQLQWHRRELPLRVRLVRLRTINSLTHRVQLLSQNAHLLLLLLRTVLTMAMRHLRQRLAIPVG